VRFEPEDFLEGDFFGGDVVPFRDFIQ